MPAVGRCNKLITRTSVLFQHRNNQRFRRYPFINCQRNILDSLNFLFLLKCHTDIFSSIILYPLHSYQPAFFIIKHPQRHNSSCIVEDAFCVLPLMFRICSHKFLSSTEQYVRYPSSITGAPVAALCLTLGALAQ